MRRRQFSLCRPTVQRRAEPGTDRVVGGHSLGNAAPLPRCARRERFGTFSARPVRTDAGWKNGPIESVSQCHVPAGRRLYLVSTTRNRPHFPVGNVRPPSGCAVRTPGRPTNGAERSAAAEGPRVNRFCSALQGIGATCIGKHRRMREGDSNPHPVKDWILSPARLPIPPLSQNGARYQLGEPTRRCQLLGQSDAIRRGPQ